MIDPCMVDAGAEALRLHSRGHTYARERMRPWADLSDASKRRLRAVSEAVLAAALKARLDWIKEEAKGPMSPKMGP